MIEPDETGSRAQTAAASTVPVTEDDPATTPAPADDNAPTVPGDKVTTAPGVPGDKVTAAPAVPGDNAPGVPGDKFTTVPGVPGDKVTTAPTPLGDKFIAPGDEFTTAPTATVDEATEPVGDEEPTVSLARRSAPDVPPHGFDGIDGAEAAPVSEGDAQAAGVPRSGDREDGEAEISATSPDGAEPGESDLGRPKRRWPAPAGALIWVLLALFGFTLVVQLRSNDADDGLAGMRQEDLVRILSDLEAQDSRLLAEIQELETSKQQLSSGVAGREAAQLEAEKRSQQLGLLAGTVAGSGPGLDITLSNVRASDVLNTVQELRGAGGEVMQLNGANGTSVRVVASSFFVDASGGGIIADGEQLTGPFRLLVIGPPSTMSTALQIPGGVVASVQNDGGSVTMDSRSLVDVTAVRKAAALRYARPVS